MCFIKVISFMRLMKVT